MYVLYKITVNLHLPDELKLAEALYHFKLDAKKELDNLHENGILNANEVELLVTSLHDIEDNLLNNDDLIREKVSEMGDEDYVALSDRLIQQGIEKGIAQGARQNLLQQITKKIQKGKSLSAIADECEITIEEAKMYINEIKNNK